MANKEYLNKTGLTYFWGKVKAALQGKLDKTEPSIKTAGILYGQVDASSTATAYTATVPGLTELYDGAMVLLKNGVVTSAAGFTINVNGLGAKPSYTNLAAATADTTIFNINYTMLFIYDSTRVSGGCWICFRGYDANTNTIGYQLRTNSSTLPMSDITYRYRLLFTSADGTQWVPSNTSTSTNATAARAVNQRPINPFGPIVYYGTTASVAAGSNPGATYLWQQYVLTLGYAFNRTGAALVLPYPKNIYIKLAPQANGSAIIDADTPYVTALPSSKDGKIYLLLGRTYSATAVEMLAEHPVFYHDGTAIRLWTGAEASGGAEVEAMTDEEIEDAINDAIKYQITTNSSCTAYASYPIDYTKPITEAGEGSLVYLTVEAKTSLTVRRDDTSATISTTLVANNGSSGSVYSFVMANANVTATAEA